MLGLAALIGIVLEDYEPTKLAPVFFLLAWFPLIALHEAGHALVALVFGFRVQEVVIGFGRPIAEWTIRGVPVRVRMYPLGGHVVPVPTSLAQLRWKNALVYLAGPGVELALVGVIALIVGPDRLLTRTDDVLLIAAQAVCGAAVIGAVSNLVPRAVDTPRGPSYSDGLGALKSLFAPREALARSVRDAVERRIETAITLDEVLDACEAAHRALPSDPHVRSTIRRAIERFAQQREDRARLRAALVGRDLPAGLRVTDGE